MRTFFRLFGVAVAVFIFHIIWQFLGVYSVITWFDGVTHFLGGVAMGFLAVELFDLLSGKSASSIPFVIRLGFVLGFVALVGIAWEWFEYGLDHYVIVVRETIGVSQASIGDTMSDLFFDLSGGLLVFLASTFFTRK